MKYRIDLPGYFGEVHNVLYVSYLKKSYSQQESRLVDPSGIQFQSKLTYEESPTQTVDQKEHKLMLRFISIIKVLWADPVAQNCT